jgi:hypothetical protein
MREYIQQPDGTNWNRNIQHRRLQHKTERLQLCPRSQLAKLTRTNCMGFLQPHDEILASRLADYVDKPQQTTNEDTLHTHSLYKTYITIFTRQILRNIQRANQTPPKGDMTTESTLKIQEPR